VKHPDFDPLEVDFRDSPLLRGILTKKLRNKVDHHTSMYPHQVPPDVLDSIKCSMRNASSRSNCYVVMDLGSCFGVLDSEVDGQTPFAEKLRGGGRAKLKAKSSRSFVDTVS
jgi:hypothetical protein